MICHEDKIKRLRSFSFYCRLLGGFLLIDTLALFFFQFYDAGCVLLALCALCFWQGVKYGEFLRRFPLYNDAIVIRKLRRVGDISLQTGFTTEEVHFDLLKMMDLEVLTGAVLSGDGELMEPAQWTAASQDVILKKKLDTSDTVLCRSCGKTFSKEEAYCPHCGVNRINCPFCDRDLGKVVNFCPFCGSTLPAPCPLCGKIPRKSGATHCPNCGGKMPAAKGSSQ